MRKNLLFILAIMLAIGSRASAQDAYAKAGDFLVQFYSGKGPENLYSDGDEIRPFAQRKLSPTLNIWRIRYDMDAAASYRQLAKMQKNPAVAIAQHNHYIFPRIKEPDDSLFSRQWNMKNTGQSRGKSGIDIRAAEAWDITTGGTTPAGDTIVIAVVEDGFALGHEDLDFWINHREIPDNGLDDDNNGYTDDYKGWYAANNSGTIYSSAHGTHVCGIAGAKGNNKVGVAGVNWHVRLLPLEYDDESDIIACYGYVYTMRSLYNTTRGKKGAFIVSSNSSFGLDTANPIHHPLWCVMYDSMGHAGVLSAIATSNVVMLNIDTAYDMPTSCSSLYMIGVTDIDNKGNLQAAYGPVNVDLGAPGEDVLSTLPGGYGLNRGTSMATPHVAGAIALLYSSPCSSFARNALSDPAETALKMRAALLSNVSPDPALTGLTATGGILNLFKSLQAVDTLPCNGVQPPPPPQDTTPVDKFVFWNIFPNPAVHEVTLEYSTRTAHTAILYITDITGRPVASYALPEASKRSVRTQIPLDATAPGLYVLTMTSADEAAVSKKLMVLAR